MNMHATIDSLQQELATLRARLREVEAERDGAVGHPYRTVSVNVPEPEPAPTPKPVDADSVDIYRVANQVSMRERDDARAKLAAAERRVTELERAIALHDDVARVRVELEARAVLAEKRVAELEAERDRQRVTASDIERVREITMGLVHAAERARNEARGELAQHLNRGRNATDACMGDWEKCWCDTCEIRRLRKKSDEALRRAEAAEGVLRDVKQVMSDCASHAGYVVGGDKSVEGVRAKWPPCETCVSALDHFEHCKAVCERIDATLDPKGVKPSGVCPTCGGLGYAKAPNGDTGPCECSANLDPKGVK